QLTGEAVGVVVDVIPAGNDLLKVKLQSSVQPPPTDAETAPPTRTSKKRQSKGKKEPQPATVLIPFVKAIAPVVDLENGRIEITPPAGLLEVNQR
ncbi:MAG: ribosome maturation factor RimM, partial [Moorea sp. SIO3I7]|nr:ribosome maturation factor RimM [Moorena sp. SIO3I7]